MDTMAEGARNWPEREKGIGYGNSLWMFRLGRQIGRQRPPEET